MKDLFKTILYQPLLNILVFLTWLMPGHSVGWAIVALTIIVRLLLLPSSLKATRAQKDMKRLAPLLEDIKKKYKGDRQGEATATMELYKEHGVSPWGSCLPLLIQLPILWVLYRVFMAGVSTEQYNLLYSFTPTPESINVMWFGMDLSQPNMWVMPILAGLAQLIQSWQMKKLNPTPAPDPDKKDKAADFSNMLTGQMMYIMPIFTVVIAMRLPAALALYWFVTTLFMVVQTWWVMRDNNGSKNSLKVKGQKPKLKLKTENKDNQTKNKITEKTKEEKRPKKKSGLAEKLASRATRYKGRKDVTVEVRRKK